MNTEKRKHDIDEEKLIEMIDDKLKKLINFAVISFIKIFHTQYEKSNLVL